MLEPFARDADTASVVISVIVRLIVIAKELCAEDLLHETYPNSITIFENEAHNAVLGPFHSLKRRAA
jgi:hypothetical protein